MAPSRQIAVCALCILLIFLFGTVFNRQSILEFDSPLHKMDLTHVVLFQFKAHAEQADIKAACERFLSLKDACIHPTTQAQYITSIKGGKDNSPEGLQNGLTHGFVVEFVSAEDRDYYVKTDPAHQSFVKSLGSLVEKVTVLDFSSGVY